MVGYGSYELAVNTFANHLFANAYVCGDRFTAADVYVGSQVCGACSSERCRHPSVSEDYGARLSAREA